MDNRFFSNEKSANNQVDASASKAEAMPDVLTLESVADPIVEAAAPEFRESLAVMIAQAYVHADQQKQASAFLQKLHTNQEQIKALIGTGATPSDLFCFGLTLNIYTPTVFVKTLSNYVKIRQKLNSNADETNIQFTLNHLKLKLGVLLSADELNDILKSPDDAAGLFTAMRNADLMSAFGILKSQVTESGNDQKKEIISAIHAVVSAGKKLNHEFIEPIPTTIQAFLLKLTGQVYDTEWNSLGRFGRRAPDGIQQLRQILFNYSPTVNETVHIELFTKVKTILASKQTSYFGFGIREVATTQFYKEQYKICQNIQTQVTATYEPGSSAHKAS